MDEVHASTRTLDLTGWNIAAIIGVVVVTVFIGLLLWFTRKP
jgi:hypothetical protein